MKKSQNIRNHGSSYYFCLMIEGSGSGFIPLTYGSGSATLSARKDPQARKVQYLLKVTATHWSPLLVFVYFRSSKLAIRDGIWGCVGAVWR
jgi:hypothetical protein